MERRLKKKKLVSMELWFYCASLISWNFGIVVRVGCFGGGTDVVLCTLYILLMRKSTSLYNILLLAVLGNVDVSIVYCLVLTRLRHIESTAQGASSMPQISIC